MSVQVVADDFPPQAADETGPYTLIVALHAKPDRADDLRELLLAQVAPTRTAPGTVTYNLGRDRLDPTTFYFFEAYTDREEFRRHLAAPHIIELLAGLPDYLTSDNDMTFLEMLSDFV